MDCGSEAKPMDCGSLRRAWTSAPPRSSIALRRADGAAASTAALTRFRIRR
ncbi:MAG: hypothetical protein R3F11_24115 [Verrucomicrobiales bacterium]